MKGAEPYGGQLSAKWSPQLREAMAGVDDFSYGLPGLSGVSSAFGAALRGQPSTTIDSKYTQDYFDKAVRAPMLKAYDRDIAPRIADAMSAKGALFSTAAGQLQQRALSDMNDTFASTLAGLAREDQQLRAQLMENAAGRQLQAASAVTQAGLARDQAGLARAQSEEAARLAREQALWTRGLTAQQLRQQSLDREFTEWSRTRKENSPWLRYAQQFVGAGTSQAVTQPSMFESLMGGIGGLFGLGALGALGQSQFNQGMLQSQLERGSNMFNMFGQNGNPLVGVNATPIGGYTSLGPGGTPIIPYNPPSLGSFYNPLSSIGLF